MEKIAADLLLKGLAPEGFADSLHLCVCPQEEYTL